MSDQNSPPAGTSQLSPRKYVALILILCVFGALQYWSSRNSPPPQNKSDSATIAQHETKPPAPQQSKPPIERNGKPSDAAEPNALPNADTPTADPAPKKSADRPAKPSLSKPNVEPRASDEKSADEKSYRVSNVSIKNLDGDVVYTGAVDLTPTIERIKNGKLLKFRDDGIVFQNREGRLPGHDDGYYHEFVHPTPKLSGPGPQRVITGKGGEFWYTPDHYRSFKRL